MKFKCNLQKLEKFRENLIRLKHKEDTNVKYLLNWRIKIKKNKFSSKLIKLKDVKGWYKNNNGNIYHKSNQFFLLRECGLKMLKIEKLKIGINQF